MLSERMSDAHGTARNEVVSEGRGTPPLALTIGRGVPAVLSFAGQGERWWVELAELANETSSRDSLELIALAERVLTRFASRPEPMLSGLYHRGTAISRWLAEPSALPDERYLASASISMPMIFLTQVLRLESLMARGLGALASQSDAPFTFATGYSQGIAAAAYASERARGPAKARLESYLELMCALGFEAASGTREAFGDDADGVMVALVGPLRPELEAAIAKVGGDVVIALENDRKRHVLSGDPSAIAKVIALLEAHKKRQSDARSDGRHGGRILEVAAEPVAASASFHHPKLAAFADRAVETSGFTVDPKALAYPVIDPATGTALSGETGVDLARAIAHSILARPGRWQRTLLAHVAPLRGPTAILELGPGDGIARVTAGALRGANALVIPMSDVNRREDVFHAPAARLFREANLIDHRELMPALTEVDGRPFVDNRYTRAAGTAPVLLPGMTPTTVDVPIVAAAANAGYWSELAGGGQVSEKIFRERMNELQETLRPGAEIVFNALLLDSYLWNLHLGKERLVQKARAAGAPICGVVVSAGIPDVESATALLDELHALGMTMNAFKPGTRAQIDQVIAIARATRHTIYIHVEGGKAGGHHSWEDLEDLLLERYWHIRQCDNLILCVGGGIATESRAVELLNGRWSLRHGQLPMPVDAIFLGTLAMACREATATPGVKTALADASGTPAWVGRGVVDGGITSGRSQLDADIHYLENAAARCGRLLDEVAGDATKVEARKDEIIAALNLTAKPYFGNFADMSWGQIIERMLALMAIGGQNPRYEDGPFLDITWRTRVFDVMRRAESRLAGDLASAEANHQTSNRAAPTGADGGHASKHAAVTRTDADGHTVVLDPVVSDLSDLDDPRAALARLTSRYPKLYNAKPHPIDVPWFLRQVCTRPGKPVPFVPVIDQDVRRYYKSDSLWQAQDPRYPADSVLVIPGPEAVTGIARPNEPVADLLSRFEHAVIQSLSQGSAQSSASPTSKHASTPVAPLGTTITSVDGGLLVTATDHHDSDWLAWVAARYEGPLASLLATPNLHANTTRLDNLVRKMIVREPGATLRLFAEGRRLIRVEHTHPRDPGRVVLTLGDQTITLVANLSASSTQHDFALTLHATRSMGGRGSHYAFLLADQAFEKAVAALYGKVLFPNPSSPIEAVAPFSVARETLTATETTLKTYRRAVSHKKANAEVPPGQVFSLAWPAIYRTLSCDELVSGLLRLVHLDNQVERLAPLLAGHPITIEARVSRIEDHTDHRLVRVEATLSQNGRVAARLVSGFHIRGAFGQTSHSRRTLERFTATLNLPSAAERELVAEVLGLPELAEHRRAELTVELTESRPRSGPATWSATGTLNLEDQEIRFSRQWSGPAEHPVLALSELLAQPASRPTPKKTLAAQTDFAPSAMDAFALAGGDLNPIHRSLFIARLAGLSAPIAHGMWTAGRLVGLVADAILGGDLSRIRRSTARFLAPLFPGEPLALDVVRESVSNGLTRVTARAFAVRDHDRVAVAAVDFELAAEKTAYVFPGQGIQHRDMGMSAFSRSPAARQVWERADRHCRQTLGFSILEVVRDNPLELEVGTTKRERLFHPEGVLHLTQLTQVAMAVLAYAQVAELEEAHVWADDAIVCGHSVGEYNAISAGLKVLPLESVVAIVYQRGCVMHGLVPRDGEGRSGYAMGVVRPHYAKLDHAGAEKLVAEVRQQTGGFIEIVNYNVKGRQYSVTGEVKALSALAKALESRQAPGSKPAWIEVPGIDVPFHSSRLKNGVADFRAGLERYLPPADQIDPEVLVGRYIPNLVARPFALTREFVTAVRDNVFGASREHLDQVLSDFDTASQNPRVLARLLLIELLAWQFASPVRWIETQDLLFAQDGIGRVQRIIEVGVGTQPTLANMARQTAALLSNGAVQITNVEAERTTVYAEDLDLVVDEPSPPTQAASTPAAESAAAPSVAAAASVAAPPVAARFIAPTPTASAAPTDRPLDVQTALTALLAIQAKVRPDQVGPTDTIDGLFDGVSSRRNQVLMDLGAEFECGSIDRAHEIPVSELAAEVARRAPRYKAPGAYLSKAIDEAAKKSLAKAGLSARDLASRLESAFGFGPGLSAHALVTMTTATRAGASARGGELTTVNAPATKADADPFLDQLVAELSQSKALSGLSLGRLGAASAGSGGVVDMAAVAAIEDRLFGEQGVLAKAAEALHPRPIVPAPTFPDTSALDNLTAELGEDFIKLVAPRFDAKRHVVFASSWASAQRNLVAAIFDRMNDRIDPTTFAQRLDALATHAGTPRIAATARYFAPKLQADSQAALLSLTTSRPTPALASPDLFDTVESKDLIASIARASLGDLAGKTALVTGAGPGSIAVAMVERLLQAGARVVVTTSSYDRKRVAYYRDLYDRWAAPGAELHVVPFNAASLQDTDALVDWLLRQETEQAGATTRVIKPAMRPDLVVPFAALKDLGTADQLGAAAEATLRAMVIGTERLVATLGKRMADASTRTHIVLPLSPNHGAFGGDGAYAESKAALEVMLAKWTSEQAVWARGTTLVGARIGWVRGTGLMAANDGVADGLTAATGIRTYSNEEMAALLIALCGDPVRDLAKSQAILADLSGGFARVPDLKSAVDEVRKHLENQDKLQRRKDALQTELDTRLFPKKARKPLHALPSWPAAPAPEADFTMDWPAMSARPEDLIVIVGYGEISPGGSARTRFELEVGERLSPPAVLELAWMCGLVRYEEAGKGGTWVDVQTNEPIAEHELTAKYHDLVRARVGVRPIEPKIAGFDAERAPVLEKIYLERDFTFPVGSEDEARAFHESAPTQTRIAERDGAWTVTRLAGSEVRVPREVKLSRRVGGQLPTGFDLGRFGVPSEMLNNVDRIALMNLVATVESFVSAGTSPEELLTFVHPSRVGTTQGSGMGGMRSLHRLYVDHLLGRERQPDMLQETLINVVFAYATSAYVGSYGPMAHPVAACATAALSIEDACDKIMVGKADVVMAGGWDDISEEGFVGFGDMNATAPTDKMLAMGLEPDQFSRANDRRRRGFVESQGGGSLLLARGDVARDLGLPVYGVVAYAGSFGDGINRSIPAPGIGSLAAAIGGQRSPLARALHKLGLTADDIAVVSKHDTSTAANDPNESQIHQTLMDTLGRTPGNPLMVHSQKTVLGHSKGGAAAWQSIMLCQMLAAGTIPGNKNLESVDPALRAHDHLLYMNRTVRPGRAFPLRAGALTSLGFGHVSALCVIAHPAAFLASLPADERQPWLTRQAERQNAATSRWAKILLGQATLYEKRGERRFASPDGTDAQRLEETAMLLDPDHRLVGEVFGRPTKNEA